MELLYLSHITICFLNEGSDGDIALGQTVQLPNRNFGGHETRTEGRSSRTEERPRTVSQSPIGLVNVNFFCF